MLRSFPQLTPELMAEAIHYYEAHQAEIDAEIHAELRADEHAENCKRRHRTRAGRNSEREEVPLVSLIIPRPCYLRKASIGPRLAALLSPRRRAKTPWPSRQMEPALWWHEYQAWRARHIWPKPLLRPKPLPRPALRRLLGKECDGDSRFVDEGAARCVMVVMQPG